MLHEIARITLSQNIVRVLASRVCLIMAMAVSIEYQLCDLFLNKFQKQAVEEHDLLMANSENAQLCLACEECLKIGIKAFNSIKDLEATLVEAHCNGLAIEFDPQSILRSLYKTWMQPTADVLEVIQLCKKYGFDKVECEEEFMECYEEVIDWLQTDEHCSDSAAALDSSEY